MNARTDRSIHKWTPEQLQFLLDRPTTPRRQLETEFRATFGLNSDTLSATAISNRRYTLLHSGTGQRAVEGLEARMAGLEASLAQAKVDLENARKATAEKSSTKAATKTKDAAKAKKVAKGKEAPVEVPTPEEVDHALINRPISELREIAKANGVKANGSKAAIVARIEEAMN